MYNVTNEFPPFFQYIAIKNGQKVAEISDVILPRPYKIGLNTMTGDAYGVFQLFTSFFGST